MVMRLLWVNRSLSFVSGMVSKPESKMAQDGEMLGQEYHNGRVRFVWSDGPTFLATSGNDFAKRQGERIRRTVVAR